MIRKTTICISFRSLHLWCIFPCILSLIEILIETKIDGEDFMVLLLCWFSSLSFALFLFSVWLSSYVSSGFFRKKKYRWPFVFPSFLYSSIYGVTFYIFILDAAPYLRSFKWCQRKVLWSHGTSGLT